ncbi:DUF4062 domain-containing protein [Neobacillus cucumis]|uniref:AAA+ ATPase domain-containing protein n=1 Tax=Neobacillus cucumis TaxID=1740721 RepID=A0A2N5H9Y8_9BACI|nr:DUF4062 domain-containing protein [Neobacillus cucumis]PLS02332.1 hypothetical protein CVD27_20340 [Neobacillus cucumis]
MPRSSKIFRLFISSTFTDLVEERKALQNRVFPELDKLCQRYGAKFQAIDLRWGVSKEAQLDHKTLDICLQEIKRSKELSPRPNFLVLLGNRYGWRPIPNKIEREEFEWILAFHQNDEVLRKWYQLDLNSVPASYYLQPRTDEYIDTELWNPVEDHLRYLFDQALPLLTISSEEKAKYRLSATEHEIREGAFKQEDAGDHVFAFFRELENVPTDTRKADFIDLLPDGTIHEHSRKQIENLKNDLRTFLPEENIKQYSAAWIDNNVDPLYIEDFCKDVLSKLSQVIERECRNMEEIRFVDKEKEAHRLFAKSRTDHFIGREKLFREVFKDLTSNIRHPLIVTGESGSGKTAFAAELSQRLLLQLPASKVISRFIGASAFGLHALELMQSILLELAPDETESILQYQELDAALHRLNEEFQNRKDPLILILDAIDQMSDSHLLPKWFMTQLPENVQMVVTVATDKKAFTLLKGMLEKECFRLLEPLDEEEARILMTNWLADEGRRLTSEQFTLVMNAFRKCPLPLFLKLVFEEVKLWHSYSNQASLPETIQGMIDLFIGRLAAESNHGTILVKHVLGLLASSRNGLEEGEILDLLSESEQVMNDFYESSYYEFQHDRLPIVFWARLFNDLEPYMIERNEGGRVLYNFYHRQIEEKVRDDFETVDFHARIAAYFEKQSIYFEEHPNTRKCSELPYQLSQSGQISECINTLSDFLFLQAKFHAGMSHDLLKDFLQLRKRCKLPPDSKDLKKLNDFEHLCRSRHAILRKYPEKTRMFALQSSQQSAHEAASNWYEKHGLPMMMRKNRLSAQDRCLHIFETGDTDIKACAWHPNQDAILTIRGSYIKVWNIHTGEEMEQFNPSIGELDSLAVHKRDQSVVVTSGNRLEMMDVRSYETIYSQEMEHPIVKTVCHPRESLYAFIFQNGLVSLYDRKKEQTYLIQTLHGKVRMAAWHPSEPEIAIWFNNDIVEQWRTGETIPFQRLYSSFRLESLFSSRHRDLCFDAKGEKLYMAQDHSVTIWDAVHKVREDNTSSLRKGIHLLTPEFVVSIMENGEIKRWLPVDGTVEVSFQQQQYQLAKLAMVNGPLLALISHEGKITIWDMEPDRAAGWMKKLETVPLISQEGLWVFQILPTLIPRILHELKFSESSALRKVGTSAEIWDSIILSSAISPKHQWIATGHYGKYIQLQSLTKQETIQYKPDGTAPILFSKWAHDEKYLCYGTNNKAWVMSVPKGTVKKIVRSEYDIITCTFSPTEEKLLVLFANGMVELIDLTKDWEETWNLEIGDVGHGEGVAVWSPNGRRLAVYANQALFLYEVSSGQRLIMKGELNERIIEMGWSANHQYVILINAKYEISIVHIGEKQVAYSGPLLSSKEKEQESEYFEKLLKNSSENLIDLESLMKEGNENQVNLAEVEMLIKTAGTSPLLAMKPKSNIIAISLGNWLKVLQVDDLSKSTTWYLENSAYDLKWNGEKLLIFTGGKGLEEWEFIHKQN